MEIEVDVSGQEEPAPSERKCLNCGDFERNNWRSGPDGPRTLCNKCGLFYRRNKSMRVVAGNGKVVTVSKVVAAAATQGRDSDGRGSKDQRGQDKKDRDRGKAAGTDARQEYAESKDGHVANGSKRLSARSLDRMQSLDDADLQASAVPFSAARIANPKRGRGASTAASKGTRDDAKEEADEPEGKSGPEASERVENEQSPKSSEKPSRENSPNESEPDKSNQQKKSEDPPPGKNDQASDGDAMDGNGGSGANQRGSAQQNGRSKDGRDSDRDDRSASVALRGDEVDIFEGNESLKRQLEGILNMIRRRKRARRSNPEAVEAT